MKKFILYIHILILTLLSSACHNSKTVQSNKAATEDIKTEQPAGTDISTLYEQDTSRLVVYFFSIASGIDGEHMLKMEDYIGEFAQKHNKKSIDYNKKAWGREGETDFCLGLKELNQKEQVEFVAGVRDLLKTAKHVNIFENQPCLIRPRR